MGITFVYFFPLLGSFIYQHFNILYKTLFTQVYSEGPLDIQVSSIVIL
jgi:hypothetical protein